jgi:DNA-binding transcriptional LysR family regulator
MPMTISAANISLRQLAALVAVIDHGGFSAAAGALHMTQSAVSQAIASLERTLEAPLLVRGREVGRGARPVPTALGQSVLRHARTVLAEVEHVAAAARAQQEQEVGTLRLGSIRSIATQLVLPVLDLFRQRYPRVAPSLWIGTDREVHEWLHDGTIDVAFVGPVLLQPLRAVAVPIVDDPWYVVLAATDPLARRRRLDVRAVAGRPYLMADGGCEPAVCELFARGDVEPDVRGRAQNTDTLLAMVAAGVGVTLVPHLGLAAFDSPEVRAVPLDPPAARTVTAVLTAGDTAPRAAVMLVDLLRSEVERRERRAVGRSAASARSVPRAFAGHPELDRLGGPRVVRGAAAEMVDPGRVASDGTG